MQIAGVKWRDSETKKIYQAAPGSEALMEYLEEQLFVRQLVASSAETPVPDRGYGNMVYKYNHYNVLLTSAPRKRENYIHVVLAFGSIDHLTLTDHRLKPGNGRGRSQDVKLYSREEVDTLVGLIEEALRFPKTSRNSAAEAEALSNPIEYWVTRYQADAERQQFNRLLDRDRAQFLQDFKELDQLWNGEISLGEFKKRLDAKSKRQLNGVNLWGFSGFSGQMFFNQLYNQAEFVNGIERLKEGFLQAVEIGNVADLLSDGYRTKLSDFAQLVIQLKNEAIEQGYSQKSAALNFAPFFISFFWGLQNLAEIPIYYKSSREALNALGYTINDEELTVIEDKYERFLTHLTALQQEMEGMTGERPDMQEIEHFLFYVDSRSKEQKEQQAPPKDPIDGDAFATFLAMVFIRSGFIVDQKKTLDEYEGAGEHRNEDSVIWRYDCFKRKVPRSFLFIWVNPNDYHAHIYEENEEGVSRYLVELEEANEEDFLNRWREYLRQEQRPAYTLADAQRETYVDAEELREWLDLLHEEKQIIFYGPPGTGKTFIAERLARVLAQHDERVRLVQFHPSYTYEEFIEGLRPDVVQDESGMSHVQVIVKPGMFYELCEEARREKVPYVLIIDEINRANTAKVFGELLYALEYRNKPVPLPYSKDKDLIVPDEVYIIGTMNTTDRSLAQLDLALRRRFRFVPFRAEASTRVLERFVALHAPEMTGLPLLIENVNRLIGSKDHRIGHSYFMVPGLNLSKLKKIWKYQIIPYLEEHFVMEPERVADFELDVLMAGRNYFS